MFQPNVPQSERSLLPTESAMNRDYGTENPPVPTAFEEEDEYYVHPSARWLFDRFPWTRRIPIFGNACEGYGVKCVTSLAAVHLLSKGIADAVLYGLIYAMLVNRFGVEGKHYQRLASLYNLGWAAKPPTAMLCDSFALFGYTKRWYLAISCLLGGLSALILGLLPARESSADIGGVLIFLTSYCKANVDILSEGFYSRLVIKHPKQGPSLISWVWWFILIGGIISSTMTGPLADAKLPEVGIFITVALEFATGIVFIFNGYGEQTNRKERFDDAKHKYVQSLKQKNPAASPELEDAQGALSKGGNDVVLDELSDENRSDVIDALVASKTVSCCCGVFDFNKDILIENWRVFVYAIVMTCCVILMVFSNIFGGKLMLFIACASMSVLCCAVSFWALPLPIAKANVFGYLQTLTFLRLPGALNTFYMANSQCVPDGPHFSYTFYTSIVAILSNVGGLIGVFCFSNYFTNVSYRVALSLPTLAIMCSSIIDISIVNRWTTRIGIPDHFTYIFGHGVIVQVLMKLQSMPMFMLLSRLCPRGSESLVYALMSGFSTLGRSASTSLGAVVMEYMWPVKTKVPCDYSNLPWLILLAHGITPAITLPFLFWLIPSAKISDPFDVNGKPVKKKVKHIILPREPLAPGDSQPACEASTIRRHRSVDRSTTA